MELLKSNYRTPSYCQRWPINTKIRTRRPVFANLGAVAKPPRNPTPFSATFRPAASSSRPRSVPARQTFPKDIADAFDSNAAATAAEFKVVRDALAKSGAPEQVQNLTHGIYAPFQPEDLVPMRLSAWSVPCPLLGSAQFFQQG